LLATLIIMGVASTLIGLLPTYASVGIWAPVMLCTLRLIQGIALGGEQGGAILIAVENAPQKRKGLFGSWSSAGGMAGLVMSTLALSITAKCRKPISFLGLASAVPVQHRAGGDRR